MDVRYIPAPPRKKGGQPAIMPGGWHLVVSATSKNKDIVWDYVRFTLRKDTRLEWCKMTSTQPAYRDIADDPFFQSNEYYRVNAELQDRAFIPFDTGNAAIYDLYNILGAAIEKIVWEQADTRSTLAEAKKEVERLMQEANR
jgi:ABC-type glycerol-3-phosphate transport system substrate-binding protein